jgi:prevent-host-death family protein
MKTVTIRELHARTGPLVREASRHGEIRVTDRGRVVAKIVPQAEASAPPYFAQRVASAAFQRLDHGGKTARGTDSTAGIAADRADRA